MGASREGIQRSQELRSCAQTRRAASRQRRTVLKRPRRSAHRPTLHQTIIRVPCILCITVKRKTITIREDQDEWIEDQHLNLSSFVREQLDELIEERE